MTSEKKIVSFKDAALRIPNFSMRTQIRIAGEIHKARSDLGISQSDLSKMSGIPQKTISRIETGVSVPNFKTVISLAEALKKEVVFNLI